MKIVKKILGGTAILLSLTQAAIASPFSYSGPAENNIDTSSVTSISFNILDTSIIQDINVSVNVMGAYGPEGFPGNNNIWLTHNGVSVRLFNSTGVYAPNAGGIMDISFDDESLSSTPTAPPFTGIVQPIDSLSAFDEMSLFGQWTLNFQDLTTFPNEGDDLIAWTLFGESVPSTVPEPISLSLLLTGLGALVVQRRRTSK